MNILTYGMAKAYTDKSIAKAANMISSVLDDVALPTVSTADNGKMLQVVDGEWSAVTITDGNEVAY